MFKAIRRITYLFGRIEEIRHLPLNIQFHVRRDQEIVADFENLWVAHAKLLRRKAGKPLARKKKAPSVPVDEEDGQDTDDARASNKPLDEGEEGGGSGARDDETSIGEHEVEVDKVEPGSDQGHSGETQPDFLLLREQRLIMDGTSADERIGPIMRFGVSSDQRSTGFFPETVQNIS